MTSRTRIGFNINADEPGDMGKLLARIDEWQPETTLVMTTAKTGMNDKAWQIYNAIQKYGGLATLRVYSPNNGNPWAMWPNYRDAVSAAQTFTDGAPNLYFELANEPRPSRKTLVDDGIAKWFADIGNECVVRKQHITMPGFATGNYELPDLVWWHPLWQAYYDNASKRDPQGNHYLAFSVHEYGHALPHLHCGGAHWPDIADPVAMFAKTADLQTRRFIAPTAQDIFVKRWKENYLLFRSWWVVQYIREHIAKDLTWDDISIWITECIWDDMNNIRNHADYPDAALKADQLNGGRKIRGLPASWQYLKTVGKAANWSGAEVVCATYDWLETVAPKCYKGWNQFTWSENQEWEPDFGMQNMTEVLDLYPGYRVSAPTEPPAEPANLTPAANDPRWQPGWKVSSTGKDGSKLRDRPEYGGQVASITFAGTDAQHIPYELLSVAEKKFAKPVGHIWAVFKLPSGIVGWSRSDVVIAEPPPIVEPEPEPEPVYITMAQAQTLVDARLGEFRSQIMAIVAEYMDAREDASDTAVIRKIGAALTVFGSTNKQIQLEDKAS